MDKKGVFEIISSLLSFYKSQSNNNPISSSGDSSSIFSSSFGDILSSLFAKPKASSSELANQNTNENKKQTDNKQPSFNQPLQSEMLNALSSHDDFVKRVMQNNNKAKK